MNTTDTQTLFLTMSAWLTGFEEVELQGTGMLETYYQTIIAKNDADDVDYFFAEVKALLRETEGDESRMLAQIRSRLMPDSCNNCLARKIILMWYTGEWYSQTDDPSSGTQINAQSYVQGLMWTAAETHPPGAKQPGYGSWAEPPIRIPT